MKLRDETKINKIFEATLRLVKQNGLSGTTMQAVAKEARLATGTVYIYFENKEALISSLFDVCIENSARDFFKNYDTALPFKIGFHTIWMNILRHRLAFFEESIFIEQCFHSPYIDDVTKANLKKKFDPLMELMKRGKQEHLIKDIDTFWLLTYMISFINEIAKRVTYYNKKLTQAIIADNFQLCWDGIKA